MRYGRAPPSIRPKPRSDSTRCASRRQARAERHRKYGVANNINTHEGGTHLGGFRSALTPMVNAYAGKNNLAKDLKDANISGDDER